MNLFKKKSIKIHCPIDGKTFPLEQVKDEAFSQKLIGEGIAIDSTGEIITSPCDGKITYIADTNHAILIECDDFNILIHIGIDTCKLQGKGFTKLVDDNTSLKLGTPLFKIDRQFFHERDIDLTTMVVVEDLKNKSLKLNLDVTCTAAKNIIFEII